MNQSPRRIAVAAPSAAPKLTLSPQLRAWTRSARRLGLVSDNLKYANPREAFANAEMLAWWYIDKFGRDRDDLIAALKEQRDKQGSRLHDRILGVIASHVLEESARRTA